jgi:hypothetical protein
MTLMKGLALQVAGDVVTRRLEKPMSWDNGCFRDMYYYIASGKS